jgi:hypothetical protein
MAMTTPVRSLPAAQCTIEVPWGHDAQRGDDGVGPLGEVAEVVADAALALVAALFGAVLPGEDLVGVDAIAFDRGVGVDVGQAAAFGEQGQAVDRHLGFTGERAGTFELGLGVTAQIDDVPYADLGHEEVDVRGGEPLEVVRSQQQAGTDGAAVGRGEAAQVADVDGAVEFDPSSHAVDLIRARCHLLDRSRPPP